MPNLPTSPTSSVGRASVRARPRRLLRLLALPAAVLPLVALAPAGADVASEAPTVRAVVGAFAADDLQLGPLDRIEPAATTRVGMGVQTGDPTPLRVVRVTLEAERHDIRIPAEVIVLEDPELPRGRVEVVREGEPGRAIATELVLRADGEIESRLVLEDVVLRRPVDRIERIGTREPPRGAIWDALARCESNRRWDAVRYVNEQLSYYGGLQFDPRTWNAFRPSAFPALASEASREEQIAVAERVLARQGWGAWPACSKRLGLR